MEYNKLTQELLAAGYSADHYPKEMVNLPHSFNKEDPLDNFSGGFEYNRWWIFEKTFKTPCGLQCKGSSCHSSLSYMGLRWTFENDLAITDCPYDKLDCKLKHEYLQVRGALHYNCNVRMVEEEYQYDGSVEGIRKLRDDEIRREKISFSLQRNGRTCDIHMQYNRDKKEWVFSYDPGQCARLRCIGYPVKKFECGGPVCPVLGRPLAKEKGNVYYDIKETGRRYDLDGTLFEGERFTNVIKGERVFDHPVSMDICRNYAKLCQDEIRNKVRWNSKYSQQLFFAEYHGRDFSVEVINIRAEQRESRDLMQDLQDIKDGIQVIHASDLKKDIKEKKRERRQKAKSSRIKKMEKKILEIGYENLGSLEQKRACKLIDFDRLDELEEIRQQRLQEEKENPVQMSLFDLMGE